MKRRVEKERSIKDIYVIGAGGFGREVAWLIERINIVNYEWDIKGFIDDDSSIWGSVVGGYTVLGGSDYLMDGNNDKWIVVAIGNAVIREQWIRKAKELEYIHYATVIDPSVIMSDRVLVGEGTIVCAETILTTDIIIGNHCIINLDCTIGHDVELSDFVTLYPSVNVSGCVRIGRCTEVGTGSAIIQGVAIESDTIIGAGAAVVRNIEESGTYVGVPVKKI